MAKQIKIRIYPNGRIEAETQGIKGPACTDLIPLLEEVLQAETVTSAYTAEYYEEETTQLDTPTNERIQTNQ